MLYLGFFLLSLLVVPEFFAQASAESKHGGALRFGITRDVTNSNPFVRTQSVNLSVRSLVYEALLGLDRNLEALPALAESWTVDPGGMVYAFHLRPGVKFHNQKPVTADDVKWSAEYGRDPKNSSTGYADLIQIEQVDILSPEQIRIRLKSPYAPLLPALASIQVLPVVPKGSLKTGETRKGTFPPGTGPFQFVDWKPAQELRVARFHGYWQKGLPYLDEVLFKVVSDETNRMQAVRAGDLDAAEDIAREQMVRIKEGKVPGIALATARAASFSRIGINHCSPPFNNAKVRKAFAYAIDKQAVVDGAFAGLGERTNQKFLRESKWFISEVQDRKQDSARARALLAEAGHPDGLKITIGTTTNLSKEAQIIQDQIRRAGFDATLQIRDYAAHRMAQIKRNFQIAMSGGATASDPDLAYYGTFHTPAKGQARAGRSQACYSNARVDELLESGRKTTDFHSRRRMYKEVVEILQEDVADIPIGFIPSGFALRRYVRDFDPPMIDAFSYVNGGILKTWMEKGK